VNLGHVRSPCLCKFWAVCGLETTSLIQWDKGKSECHNNSSGVHFLLCLVGMKLVDTKPQSAHFLNVWVFRERQKSIILRILNWLVVFRTAFYCCWSNMYVSGCCFFAKKKLCAVFCYCKRWRALLRRMETVFCVCVWIKECVFWMYSGCKWKAV